MTPQPERRGPVASTSDEVGFATTCYYKILIVLTCIVRLYKCTHK